MCPKCSPNNFCRDPKHGNSEDNPAHKSSCRICSHGYFNNVLNEKVFGREGGSRARAMLNRARAMYNHSRHNSYGEGRGREFFGTVGGVFGSTATHLFTSLQGTKSKGAHIFDTGARTCSCGKDISSRPPNHTQCLTCYRHSQNNSESESEESVSEDEEYERECTSCGGDISNRPLNFTQCLDCWRGGRGGRGGRSGRSNNNFFVRFS